MNPNSQIAHQNSLNFKEKHHDKIVSVLSKISKPLTYKEIADKSNLDPVAVARRMKELLTLEKVKKLESRICSIANSRCATYSV